MKRSTSIRPRGRAARILIRVAMVMLCLVLVCMIGAFTISEYVRISTDSSIYSGADELGSVSDVDCIVILGAGLKSDGTPSHMLEDRIKVGVNVMNVTGIKYILMSGDRSGDYYDEPAAMKTYAESLGVEPERILIDGKGYSTYESISRLKDEYGFERVIVITQKYHLHRALYISRFFGIESVGVSSDLRGYRNQTAREIREILARVKDFFMCM